MKIFWSLSLTTGIGCLNGEICHSNLDCRFLFEIMGLYFMAKIDWILTHFQKSLNQVWEKSFKPSRVLTACSILVRDSLPLYPLFISAVCGLGSERFGSWKSEKSTTPPGIVPQKARATIKPLHSVPAAWNSIKEIFIYSVIPITPQNNMCSLR